MLILVKYNFEIKYRTKNINFANNLSEYFNYKNDINDEIYFLTLQNKLKNIIIIIINLKIIFIRNVAKIFKLIFVENVKISQIEIQNTKQKIFKENKRNLINNIVIQQLRYNNI